MDTLISGQLQTASSLSFSSDLVRAMHASGSRETREMRASPVSRHQSRTWPFACLAFCLTDYRRKRDCSQSRTALLMASFTKPCFSQLHTNSVFLHSCIKAASSSHKHPSRVPRLSTHDSFHCISYNGHLPKGETCCSLLSALLVPMKPQLFREC